MNEGINDFYRYWLRRILKRIDYMTIEDCCRQLIFIHEETPWQEEYPNLYKVCVNTLNQRVKYIIADYPERINFNYWQKIN
jgi:hypothetical protein